MELPGTRGTESRNMRLSHHSVALTVRASGGGCDGRIASVAVNVGDDDGSGGDVDDEAGALRLHQGLTPEGAVPAGWGELWGDSPGSASRGGGTAAGRRCRPTRRTPGGTPAQPPLAAAGKPHPPQTREPGLAGTCLPACGRHDRGVRRRALWSWKAPASIRCGRRASRCSRPNRQLPRGRLSSPGRSRRDLTEYEIVITR